MKTLFKPEEFENAVVSFSCGRKTFDAFQSETSVFKFLRRRMDGKHLLCFQSETSVFKFLRRSVDGKHLMHFQSETSVF